MNKQPNNNPLAPWTWWKLGIFFCIFVMGQALVAMPFYFKWDPRSPIRDLIEQSVASGGVATIMLYLYVRTSKTRKP